MGDFLQLLFIPLGVLAVVWAALTFARENGDSTFLYAAILIAFMVGGAFMSHSVFFVELW
jgi:hypothetical protein